MNKSPKRRNIKTRQKRKLKSKFKTEKPIKLEKLKKIIKQIEKKGFDYLLLKDSYGFNDYSIKELEIKYPFYNFGSNIENKDIPMLKIKPSLRINGQNTCCCGAKPGQLHEIGCWQEECPICANLFSQGCNCARYILSKIQNNKSENIQ